MNKYDRRKMTAAALKCCSIVIPAVDEFSSVTDSLKANEETKLDNIPESLQNSRQAENMETAIEKLEALQGLIENIQDSCEEILDITEVKLPAIHLSRSEPGNLDDGPRKNRYQILLPDQLILLMKLRALQLNISCNEFVCQALQNELLKDPNE